MELQQDTEELYELAYRDDLTGLYNRRYLNRVLARSLESPSRPATYCFLMMDIDFFKDINDNHGHMIGDRALVSFAGFLQGNTRGEDIPIRFAGDEFIVYLPKANLEQGLLLAQRLLPMLRDMAIPTNGDGHEIRMSLSIGVADFPAYGENWEEVLAAADQALYMAKQRGRDRAAPPPAQGEEPARGDDLSGIFPCPEYVGQQQLSEWLLQKILTWKKAETGPHAPVFIVKGCHGTGKTRLINEFQSRAAGEDINALRLEASIELKEVCYGSLIRALLKREGSGEALREKVLQCWPDTAEALWKHFFFPAREEHEPVTREASEQFFARILAALGDSAGSVLLVDNIDLLDRDTLRLIESIHEDNSPDQRFFFLATVLQHQELDAGEPVAHAGGETILFDPPRNDIPFAEVVPLDSDATRQMVMHILPTLRPSDQFFDQLYGLSKGTPLYIEEALKYMIQTGQLVFERQAWRLADPNLGGLPKTLRELIAKRLALLSPEVRSMLEKASVMGSDVLPDLLPKIDNADEGYTLDLLNTAKRLGVLDGYKLWEEGDFRFHSNTAKDVTHDQLSEEDRVAWHMQMARLQETLKDSPDLLQLGPLLYHYQMADNKDGLEAVRERLNSFVSTSQPRAPAATPSDRHDEKKRKKAKWADPKPLPQEGIKDVLELFRAWRVSVQTSRLYPDTSQIVLKTYEKLHQSLEQILSLSKTVDFSEVEGNLLINGEKNLWNRSEKGMVDAFAKSLSDVGLNGIAFARGLRPDELTIFVTTWMAVLNLKREPSEAWAAIEKRTDLHHIDINARVYIALESATIPGPAVGAEEPGELRGTIEQLNSMMQLLQAKTGRGDPSFPTELSGEDAERFSRLLKNLEGVLRVQPGVGAPLQPVETHPPTREAAPPATATSPPKPSLPPLEGVMQTSSVHSCIADIVSAERTRETRGYEQLSRMGREAIEPLYEVLLHADDARSGEVCATFLKSIDQEFQKRSLRELQEQKDPAVQTRLLRHAVPSISDADASKKTLLELLQTEDNDSVVREVVRQVETLFPEETSSLLLQVMPACPIRVQAEICPALERAGDEASIEPLLKIAAEWKGAGDADAILLIERACQVLGNFDTAQVVEQLAALLMPPSRIPWRRTPPLQLRKAALAALERIGSRQVLSLLSSFESDKDPWIRHRVGRILRTMKPST